MKKNKAGILLSMVLMMGLPFNAQAEKPINGKVVLNEVLENNASNFMDEYGQRSAWIEVFNKSFSSVDLAGFKLRVSQVPGDTASYTVPKGDVLTVVKPRQHALFWADNQPNRGTFHTSLSLATEGNNWIGLYDNSNKLLDQITIKEGTIGIDQSYARESDAEATWVVKSGTDKKHYVTPSTNNTTIDKNVKVDKFQTQDEDGFGMAVTAMSVVFSGLLILFIAFKCSGKIAMSLSHKNAKSEEKKSAGKTKGAANGEVYAAIAMALHEYEGGNIHDEESGSLTIVQKTSPWNAKNTLQRVLPAK